jgi:hypothetical protein
MGGEHKFNYNVFVVIRLICFGNFENLLMNPLNFFKGSFFDPAFKAKPAP